MSLTFTFFHLVVLTTGHEIIKSFPSPSSRGFFVFIPFESARLSSRLN